MVMSVIGRLTNDRWLSGPYGRGKRKIRTESRLKLRQWKNEKIYSEAIRFSARKFLPVPPLLITYLLLVLLPLLGVLRL